MILLILWYCFIVSKEIKSHREGRTRKWNERNKKGKLRSVTNWPKPILFVQQSNNNLSTAFDIHSITIHLSMANIHTLLLTHTLTSFITSTRTYIQLFRVIKTRIFCFFTSNYPLFLPFVRKHLFHCPCRESEIAFYFVYVINRTLLFVTNYHSNAHTLTLLKSYINYLFFSSYPLGNVMCAIYATSKYYHID